MRKIIRFFLPVGLVVLSLVLVAGLIIVNKAKRPERKEEAVPATMVDAIPVERVSLNLSVFSQGSVAPRTETTLVAEVSGIIVNVSPNFVAGGFFRKGETLLEIDPSDYRAGLKRAQANLASRKAQFADQKARAEQALKDWKNMGRQGEPSDLTLRKPQLAEAQANVQAAEAELQKAERDLQRTHIKVPYDGLVRSKQADIGQYVAPGTPLGVTFDIDTAEIRLPLSATDVSYLDLPSATDPADKPRLQVTLTTGNNNIGGQWQAEIIRTEGVIDEKSRVTYAVAQVVDPYGVLGRSHQAELKVGTFVRAEILGLRANNVFKLPRSVLRPDNTVLVANAERKLEIRQVNVLRAEPRSVYIRDGIVDGDMVITTSLDAAIPGTQLAISGEDRLAPAQDSSTDSTVASTGAEQ
jgi:RND family efflux transporter MFP subunit